MSTIAVIDLETSGLAPSKDQVLEVCWALVDVESAQVVEVHDFILHADTNDAASVNALPVPLLQRARRLATTELPLALPARTVLAHNASFDKQWEAFECTEPGLEGQPLEWLCTAEDFRWPKAAPGLNLVGLALAHGVGVVSAHRAYSDVLTTCALLARVHETVPLEEQLAYARRPRGVYLALAPFEQKDTVKAHGFKWYPERKQWLKRLLPEEASALPFEVRKLDAAGARP